MMKKRFALAACLAAAALLPSGALGGQAPASPEYATRAVDASRITHRQLIGGINNRLTVIHEMAYEDPDDPDAPLRTALYEPVDRLWVGGVGVAARRGGPGGYEYGGMGLNTGYDWTAGDLTVGVAAAYTRGTIKSNEIDTRNKVDAVNFGVYASHDPLLGLFYDMNASYGMSWNRSVSMEIAEGPGAREGRFRSTTYGLGGNIGWGFDLAFAKVTPTIGFQWARHTQEAYAETAGGGTPNWFAEAKNDVVEIPLAVRIGTSWQLAAGAVLSPEVRAAYILQAGDRRSSVIMGPAGGPGTAITGVEDGSGRARIGAGLKANLTPTFDAFVDYNLEFGGGYKGTNFNTGLGVSF